MSAGLKEKTAPSTRRGKAVVFISACAALLRDSATSWLNHHAPKMGAALAYYTAFSLAPLFILLLSGLSPRRPSVANVQAFWWDSDNAWGAP